MLFALARRGDAPESLLEVNRRGVPAKAILLTSSIGFLATGLAYLSPDTPERLRAAQPDARAFGHGLRAGRLD